MSHASPSSSSPPSGLDPSLLLNVVRRQWPLIVVATLASVVAVAAFTFLRDPVYRSEAVVMVDVPSRSGAGAVSLFSTGQAVRSLANEIEVLRQSDLLAERVARSVHGFSPGEPAGPELRAAMDELRTRVVFEPVSNEVDMIRVSARSVDPDEAARIANAYVDAFAERGRETMRSSATGSRAFLQEQEASRRAELAGVESQISSYLAQSGAVDLDAESEAIIGQAADLDAQVEQTSVDLQTAQAQLGSIRRQLATVEPNLRRRVASSADREIEALQERIAAMEVQAADYYAADPTLQGAEDRNPELATLRRRIDEMQDRVDRLSAELVDEVAAVGGANGTDGTGMVFAGQLRRDAAQAQVRVRGLEAQLAALQARRASMEARVRQLPRQTIRLAQLRRQQAAGEQAYEFVVSRLQEARLAEASEPGYVEVVRAADVPTVPVEPRPVQNLTLGLLLGLMLGTGLALARYVGDRRLHSAADVRELGLPVLASVPSFSEFVAKELGGVASVEMGEHHVDPLVALGLHPFSPVTEAFRRVRTAVAFSAPDRTVKTLLVTSALQGEGKSSVALGLAISRVQAGQRVLYIDADLRRPVGRDRLGLSVRSGLSDLLFASIPADTINWEPFRYALDGTSAGAGLYVLTAGRPVPNATELLGSQRMRHVLAAAAGAFDVVVVDSAPVLPVPDSLLLAGWCDAALLVARVGQTTQPVLRRAGDALAGLGDDAARLAGVVLNDAPVDNSPTSYGYGYGYGNGDTADIDWAAVGAMPTTPSGDGAAPAPRALPPSLPDLFPTL